MEERNYREAVGYSVTLVKVSNTTNAMRHMASTCFLSQLGWDKDND